MAKNFLGILAATRAARQPRPARRVASNGVPAPARPPHNMSDEAKHSSEHEVVHLCQSWLAGDRHTKALRRKLRAACAALVPSVPGALVDVHVDTTEEVWMRLRKLYGLPFGDELFSSVRLVCTGDSSWSAKCCEVLGRMVSLRGLCLRGAWCMCVPVFARVISAYAPPFQCADSASTVCGQATSCVSQFWSHWRLRCRTWQV